VATGNTATHNNNSCPGSKTGLPFDLSGVGILIAGGQHIVLQNNQVHANRPSGSSTTLNGVSVGGIVVASTAQVTVFGKPYYGSDSADNSIVNNTVTGNQPFDLVNDGLGTSNRFQQNVCNTSNPPGLCQ
jgi:hypothetical protein